MKFCRRKFLHLGAGAAALPASAISCGQRGMSVSLPAEISRQRSSFALALRSGEILPRAKPKEANRVTSSARNATRTSPFANGDRLLHRRFPKSGASDGGSAISRRRSGSLAIYIV